MTTTTMDAELPGGQVPSILTAVEAATRHHIELLLEQPAGWWDEPSELDGWTRRTVLAHLHYGAQASRAVTLAALDGRSEPFYPGGDSQRDRTLIALDHRPLGLVTSEVIDQAERLAELWSSMDAGHWTTRIDEPGLGPVALSRLAALRLTEVEVHGTDLGAGHRWSDAFIRHLLPLRVAWLPRQHWRYDADQTIRARWYLAGDRCGWLIGVDGPETSIEHLTAGSSAPDDALPIGGSDRDALVLVLGRRVPDWVGATGPTSNGLAIRRFRAAFPGP